MSCWPTRGDDDLRALAREEVEKLDPERGALLEQLLDLLRPRDPNDDRDVIIEIRAGTGGAEAGLFAADLFRMYLRYAEGKRWKVEVLNTSETDLGGYSEVVFEVDGRGAYSRLKYESGVHRVQRVPDHRGAGADPYLHGHGSGTARASTTWRSRSTRPTCGSTSTAPAGTAARA